MDQRAREGGAADVEWPAVVSRILTIDPEVALVDLLAGEAPGIDDGELSPLWSCVPVRHLLQLVFHAVLEATSRRGKWDVKEPSTPRQHWRGPEDGPIVERPYRLLP